MSGRTWRTTGNPYGFQGRRLDPETGLLYFRARYYDPETGRFISRDPVWDPGNFGNQYSFVGHGPVSWQDPEGLQKRQTPRARTFWGGVLEYFSGKSTQPYSTPVIKAAPQRRKYKKPTAGPWLAGIGFGSAVTVVAITCGTGAVVPAVILGAITFVTVTSLISVLKEEMDPMSGLAAHQAASTLGPGGFKPTIRSNRSRAPIASQKHVLDPQTTIAPGNPFYAKHFFRSGGHRPLGYHIDHVPARAVAREVGWRTELIAIPGCKNLEFSAWDLHHAKKIRFIKRHNDSGGSPEEIAEINRRMHRGDPPRVEAWVEQDPSKIHKALERSAKFGSRGYRSPPLPQKRE